MRRTVTTGAEREQLDQAEGEAAWRRFGPCLADRENYSEVHHA